MALLSTVIGRGVVASRPAAGSAGALYYATDVSGGQLQRDNGSSWDSVEGGVPTASWVTKTANYTLTGADQGIEGDATSGNITQTLPTAVGATQRYAIKKKDASVHTVTVATTSSQTIDGVTTHVLSNQWDAIEVESDGTNWGIVAQVAASSGGSVSSVAMSVPSGFSVSGSPVTSSGTLAVTYTGGQGANQVLATPDSASGAMGLRALATGDLPQPARAASLMFAAANFL